MNNKIFLPAFYGLLFLKSSLYSQTEPYHPLRIQNEITLDGKLNEPEWQHAQAESDFMQYDPIAGAEPTEKTEARIIYNDDYLFVSVTCFDSEPSKIVRIALERDFELGIDDGIAFIIDTYNDKSSGLSFITNTLGARWDEEFTSDARNENESYNTFWDVASNADSSGYTVEYRIPF